MRKSAASSRLDKKKIRHILRSVAAITQARSFVIIGTGAVVAGLKHVPLDMMMTRELDIYAESPDSEQLSDLIDGTLGEGSQFDVANGYYAHGVGVRTACMPSDWKTRATVISIPNDPGAVCLCPDPNDIAIAKACAWREKDRDWLVAGARGGVLRPDVMLSRIGDIDNPNAPDADTVRARVITIMAAVPRPGEVSEVLLGQPRSALRETPAPTKAKPPRKGSRVGK